MGKLKQTIIGVLIFCTLIFSSVSASLAQTCEELFDTKEGTHLHLSNLATLYITDSFILASNNPRRVQEQIKGHFTDKGWNSYLSTLQELQLDGLLKPNTNGHIKTIHSAVIQAPIIKKISNDEWEAKAVSIHTMYENTSKQNSQSFFYTKTILQLRKDTRTYGDENLRISKFRSKLIERLPIPFAHTNIIVSNQNSVGKMTLDSLVKGIPSKHKVFFMLPEGTNALQKTHYQSAFSIVGYLSSRVTQAFFSGLYATICPEKAQAISRDLFSDSGWTSLMSFLKHETIIKNLKAPIQSFELAPPILIAKGVVDERSYWMFQLEPTINDQKFSIVIHVHEFISKDKEQTLFKVTRIETHHDIRLERSIRRAKTSLAHAQELFDIYFDQGSSDVMKSDARKNVALEYVRTKRYINKILHELEEHDEPGYFSKETRKKLLEEINKLLKELEKYRLNPALQNK